MLVDSYMYLTLSFTFGKFLMDKSVSFHCFSKYNLRTLGNYLIMFFEKQIFTRLDCSSLYERYMSIIILDILRPLHVK